MTASAEQSGADDGLKWIGKRPYSGGSRRYDVRFGQAQSPAKLG